MGKSLNILFVSSELYPFAKESGVGDVSYGLPLALRELGHDVRIIIPKYGNIPERKNNIHNVNRLKEIHIKIGDRTEMATIKSTTINSPNDKVQTYVVTNYHYFDSRKGVYHDPLTWEEYPDNAERFIFFNRAVPETCNMLGWWPHIIHCNDWQTALLPSYIRNIYPNKFRRTKIVLTIHNFYRQGSFDLSEFWKSGFDNNLLPHFKHKNRFNFLKGGIIFSNFVTTVSKTYSEEILSDRKYGDGLNVYLKEKKNSFKGILNGIDKGLWNPRTDELISYQLKNNFDFYKQNNKKNLSDKFGIKYNQSVPLFGMIPRIGYQKGTQLIVDAADKIFTHDLQLVLLGQGDTELKEQLINISEKYPNKLKLRFDFDEGLSHQIEAGCDFFLMPSHYEPCGLNLMYSLAYGTVPVVRNTGGMADIAIDINSSNQKSNAIVFNEYSVDDFADSITRAVGLFKDRQKLMSVIANGMSVDYSWTKSAAEYENIYRMILKDNNKEL